MKPIQIQQILKIAKILYIVHLAYNYYNALNKRSSVKYLNLPREESGFYNRYFREMMEQDEDYFLEATRMKKDQFTEILALLNDKLKKYSQRKSIGPDCRLLITLMYLANGCSVQVIASNFKVGVSTVREIILETCSLLWKELGNICCSPPNNDEWKKIAEGFWSNWQMPNCLGPVDGRKVMVNIPSQKSTCSIDFFAACDSKYCFTAIHIADHGNNSSELKNSGFVEKIVTGKLDTPSPKKLPNSDNNFPYFFVADAGFPLKTNIMRPYPGKQLPADREFFNSSLSRVRRLIENSFGILVNRWQILGTAVNCRPRNVEKIILATFVLHNFLMLKEDNDYCPQDYVDREENGVIILGHWRDEYLKFQSPRNGAANHASHDAFALRDSLKEYLYKQKST